VSLDAALLFTVTSLAVYLCATKHLRFPNKQWWSTPNCKARMLFLFTDKVAFSPSPDCPFCEFQETDVKSAWFHSGLNLLLRVSVHIYWRLIWIHAALFCLTLAGCNHLLSICLLLENQPFVTIFVSAYFVFPFLLVLIVKESIWTLVFFFLS
jgi:hypothetical protein